MNHKRKKPRSKVKCLLCTDNRYFGNSAAADDNARHGGARRKRERAKAVEELKSNDT